MSVATGFEGLLRELAPQVTGILVHRFGDFSTCEDAVQEALLAAAVQWPADGMPDNPKGWLITVASRRLVDQLRAESARRRREVTAAALEPADELVAPAAARLGSSELLQALESGRDAHLTGPCRRGS